MKTIIEIQHYRDEGADLTESIMAHETELDVCQLNIEFLNSLNDGTQNEMVLTKFNDFENVLDIGKSSYDDTIQKYVNFLLSKGFRYINTISVSFKRKQY